MNGVYSNLFGIYYYFIDTILPKDTDKEIVLFLHGAGGSHKHWRYIIPRLDARIYPICIDLPGHGNSPGFVPDSMHAMLIMIKQLLLDLGIKKPISIVGHSFGGLIAQAFALHNSKLLNKLILISTAPNLTLHPALLEQITVGTFDVNFILEGFTENINEDIKWLVINDLALMRLKVQSDNFLGSDNINYTEQLTNIKVPSLILYGDQDRIVSPRRSRKLGELIANSEIQIINGAGHYPHLEVPNVIISPINKFLSLQA